MACIPAIRTINSNNKKLKRLSMSKITQEFIRYLGVGGIAFITDIFTIYLLTSLADINYLIATLIAFIFGTWVNYILSIHWVFKHRKLNNYYTEFSLFILIGIITLGLSLMTMMLLVQYFSLNILLAKCITTCLTLVTNFTGRRILLFSRTENNYLLVAQFNEIKL